MENMIQLIATQTNELIKSASDQKIINECVYKLLKSYGKRIAMLEGQTQLNSVLIGSIIAYLAITRKKK